MGRGWTGCIAICIKVIVSVTVLSIGDSDTIRVRQAGKTLTVQLACIDAPESAQTPYGISGININLAEVEDGQGFAYHQYLSRCNGREYLDAEYRASRRRYGVWKVEGGITRPWDFRRGRRSAVIPEGTTPGGRRYRCSEISSYAKAQELLRQGHNYLDGDVDGEACESMR